MPQRIAAARAALNRDKGWLRAAGRDVARAQGEGQPDKAERLAARLEEARQSVRNRQTALEALLAEAEGASDGQA